MQGDKLEHYLQQAEVVICRSGYSTVMDLMALEKKAIFIPTPGQTEQEYLAKWLMDRKMALVYIQKKFNLKNALSEALSFNCSWDDKNVNALPENIDRFLTGIKY